MFKLSLLIDCKYCNATCIKRGRYKIVQKYQCVGCKKYQRDIYTSQRYNLQAEEEVRLLNNECVGISSISRILRIPKNSIQMLLWKVARKAQRPVLTESNQDYEVDEIYTFAGSRKNKCFIIYAINRCARQIIDFTHQREYTEAATFVVFTGSQEDLYGRTSCL